MCARRDKEINYCLRCGAPLELGQHFGGIRPACPDCGWVYFADPKVAVAALIEKDKEILLVRRANNPQRGLWTLPAGFIDAGEDPIKAIQRECSEEVGLTIEVTGLYDVIFGQEHEHGAHLLIVYFAQILSGKLHPGDDVDQAAFFPYQDMPPLAFETTKSILKKLNR
jgi:8-oxo-dGTP diphosphatase